VLEPKLLLLSPASSSEPDSRRGSLQLHYFFNGSIIKVDFFFFLCFKGGLGFMRGGRLLMVARVFWGRRRFKG